MPVVSTLTAGALSLQSLLRTLLIRIFYIQATNKIIIIIDKHQTFSNKVEMLLNPT